MELPKYGYNGEDSAAIAPFYSEIIENMNSGKLERTIKSTFISLELLLWCVQPLSLFRQ